MPDKARYMREYRQTLEGRATLEAQKRRQKARRRAVDDLISLHEAAFNSLFDQHLRRVEEDFRKDQVDT